MEQTFIKYVKLELHEVHTFILESKSHCSKTQSSIDKLKDFVAS